MARFFISYKRNADPDEGLAQTIVRLLHPVHQVFIDTTMQVGQEWARTIEREIEAADYLVLLLSELSVQSQMVAEEVRIADAARRRQGKPRILPIRIAYEGKLPYDLAAILTPLQYALWRTKSDTPKLEHDLLGAISGNPLPAPALNGNGLPTDVPLPSGNPIAALEAPEGTMAASSPFYVERAADRIVADEETHRGYTVTLKGPRQMGKSSLLGRVIARARDRGRRVVFLDLQGFGRETLQDPVAFYSQFAYLVQDALQLEDKTTSFWKAPLSLPLKCKLLMERHVLPSCGDAGLVLAIDEADSLLDTPHCADFFGMLRAWNNLRANSAIWGGFCLAQAISTEPSLLIDVLTQSPFNVGAVVTLEDFSLTELGSVNRLHSAQLNLEQLERLHHLLAGHPYLCRKALYLLCRQRYRLEELLADSDSETGPFGDHLRTLLSRVTRQRDLVDALRRALTSGRCDEMHRHRLIAGGILLERGGRLRPRNELYFRYFSRVLNE